MIVVVKERLKTFLLLSLVFLSIVLTRQVWMQSPYETLAVFEDEEIETTNYLFTDMIKPHKYLLNFDKKSHTIFHSDENNNLWTSAHSSLVSILSSNAVEANEISNEEFIKYIDNESIVFYFPEKYNTYILARSLDVSKPNSITEKIPEVDSIYIHLGSDKPYIVFSQDDQYLKVYDSNLNLDAIKSKVDEIEESKNFTFYYPMRDTLNVNSDIYIPISMSKVIPTIYVENELNTDNIEDMRNIAEAFFQVDIDYIGEIIERNGSIVYLFEDKVLKINQSGLLEYFAPLEEEVNERNLYISLIAASEFLSDYMDIPKDMYLGKIEEIESGRNSGYRLTFKYRIQGFPVILQGDVAEDFIQLDVYNKHIRNYKRFIRKAMSITDYNIYDNSKMLSAFEIINMSYDLLKKDYIEENDIPTEDIDEEKLKQEILSTIRDISIAYLDPCEEKIREKLIGVWVLQTENKIYAFDVHEGNLVLKKNQ